MTFCSEFWEDRLEMLDFQAPKRIPPDWKLALPEEQNPPDRKNPTPESWHGTDYYSFFNFYLVSVTFPAPISITKVSVGPSPFCL
jgi:hypothetical protein